MKFKFKKPSGILGGILTYGLNPAAIIHAWFFVFSVRDAERMRLKREARLKRESEAKALAEQQPKPEDTDGDHRG